MLSLSFLILSATTKPDAFNVGWRRNSMLISCSFVICLLSHYFLTVTQHGYCVKWFVSLLLLAFTLPMRDYSQMPLITVANARELSAKGAIARRAKRAIERNRLALIDQLLQQAVDNPPVKADCEAYNLDRLLRTRKQIDLLSTRLEEELEKEVCDAMLIDRIASAIARLSEIERQFSGRPLPGTLRPTAKPTRANQAQAPQLPPALPDAPQGGAS